MMEIRSQWGQPEVRKHTKADQGHTSSHPRSTIPRGVIKPSESSEAGSLGTTTGVWLNAELRKRETTAKLDDQDPVTLYFLGRVIKLDKVVEVYVDQKQDGEIKHWTVIESRDFDVMDQVYDIELDTREKFPYADLDFRVTIYTDDGPSATHRSMKIYDAG